jgi:hypothetical protein
MRTGLARFGLFPGKNSFDISSCFGRFPGNLELDDTMMTKNKRANKKRVI